MIEPFARTIRWNRKGRAVLLALLVLLGLAAAIPFWLRRGSGPEQVLAEERYEQDEKMPQPSVEPPGEQEPRNSEPDDTASPQTSPETEPPPEEPATAPEEPEEAPEDALQPDDGEADNDDEGTPPPEPPESSGQPDSSTTEGGDDGSGEEDRSEQQRGEPPNPRDATGTGNKTGRGEDDNTVALRLPRILFSGLPPVRSIALSTNRLTLATGHSDGSVRIWNLQQGLDEPLTIQCDSRPPLALAFTPPNDALAILGLHRLDLHAPSVHHKVASFESVAELSCLALSGDGTHLAIGEREGDVSVRSLPSLSSVHRLPGYGGVVSLTWCQDREQFAVASTDNVVRFWSPRGSPRSQPLLGHLDWVSSIVAVEGSRMLVTGSWDQTLRAWDTDVLSELTVFRGHTSRVVTVAASPDGQFIASGTDAGVVKVWDALLGMELATFREHTKSISGAVFITEDLLITASEDGSARVFNVATSSAVTLRNVNKARASDAPERSKFSSLAEKYTEFMEKANQCEARKDDSQAADYFRKATEVRPEYAEPYVGLGECLLRLRKIDEAVAAFRHAVQVRPDSAWYPYRLGAALYDNEEYAEAVKALEQACEVNPDLSAARLLLAHAYRNRKRYGQAVREYNEVIRRLPRSHKAFHGLGLAHARLRAWDLAIENLKKAIECQSDYAPAYSDLIDTILTANPRRAKEANSWASLARSQGIELRAHTLRRLKTISNAP